jgi:hypothetical protein
MIDVVANAPEPCSEELVELLDQCERFCGDLLSELVREPTRFALREYLWRFAILYVVLSRDMIGALSALVKRGTYNRAALVLRRSLFEYYARFRYYARNDEQARIASEHATPRLRLFLDSIWDDPTATLIEDPAFDLEAHEDENHAFTNLLTVLEATFESRDAKRLYGRYYRFPSPIAHGYAESSIDVMTISNDGNNEVHIYSRRPAGDIAMNAADFAVELLSEIDEHLGLDAPVSDLRDARRAAAAACGIEIVQYKPRPVKSGPSAGRAP